MANVDDKFAEKFLNISVPGKKTFSLSDGKPFALGDSGIDFTLLGEKIHSKLSGEFNLYNILAAISFTQTQNVDKNIIKRALEKFSGIRGRMERIEAGQDFTVIVDYAHTPDSLEKVYQVFQNQKKICVLGRNGRRTRRLETTGNGQYRGAVLRPHYTYERRPVRRGPAKNCG